MSTPLPLFGTGTARTGSNLLGRMLSVNRDVMVASDPYLELFRSFRNAIIRASMPRYFQRGFNPRAPFQDYYFLDEQIQIMDAIQAADLNMPFDRQEWPRLYEASCARATLECRDLIPHFQRLVGSTYREMIDHSLEIIANARDAGTRKWVGFRESWTIEFFTALARAYPDARFFVILRDPRAAIASALRTGESNPSLLAHALSFARQWRKYVAFALHYQQDPLFANRLYVLTHEQLLRNPERKAEELCKFLGVDYDPAMLDTENYFDYATGKVWKGNSAFEKRTSGISTHRMERWRTALDRSVVKMVDTVCGPEMKLLGYEPVTDTADRPSAVAQTGWPAPDALTYIIRNNKGNFSWRTDLGDPQRDYGFELFRRALLAVDGDAVDRDLVRRSFLFEDVFERLKHAATGAPAHAG